MRLFHVAKLQLTISIFVYSAFILNVNINEVMRQWTMNIRKFIYFYIDTKTKAAVYDKWTNIRTRTWSKRVV